MVFLQKLLLNLGSNALRVLGPLQYLRYLMAFMICFPQIVQAKDLRVLDRRMGSRDIRVQFQGRRFVIDCPRVDRLITDGSFTFGIIREMFIRNCYIRHGIGAVLASAQTILDLGANRGAFSTMAATRAHKVLMVEANPDFVEAIRANMFVNRLSNYVLETAFIGGSGKYEDRRQNTVSVQELIDKHQITKLDLVKIDIEGSEFALFQSAEWLQLVGAICMEVHPDFGSVQDIIDSLEKKGFSVVATDQLFRAVQMAQDAAFIYAVKRAEGPGSRAI